MRKSRGDYRLVAVKLPALTIAVMLVAVCDGNGWTGKSGVHQAPGGFYLGSFTATATQPTINRQATGMISEDFDAHFLLANQHYAGTVAVDGPALSGTLSEYRGRQGAFIGFDGLSVLSLDGW